LRFAAVEHFGNQNESPEEVERVAVLVAGLLGGGATWTNVKGENQKLALDDILIVAPYNAQVSALAERLPVGARIGTVDKFQGQEAPVVFYSMATSTPEDAPRGMEFLYSLNRFNVAISRATGVPNYNYNASNELTSSSSGSYSYDANGNTLSDASGKQ